MDFLQQFSNQVIWVNLLWIASIILVAFVSFKILERLVKRYGKRLAERTRTEIDDKILEFIDRFLARIILIIALFFIGERLSLFVGERAFRIFQEILYVVVVLIVTSLVIRIFGLLIDWYLKRVAQRTETEIDREFGPLIKRVVQIVTIVTGLLVIFNHFNIDAKGLITTLGVGSLAIALAAQDTLANMIAGFVIMFDRPFRVGDRIKMPNGTVGEITEIGLRTVKLLDFEKNLHIVPNSEIIKSIVVNYSYPQPLVRVKIDVGVAYGTDLDRAKSIMVDMYKNHPKILDQPEPKAFFVNFGESSLDLTVIGYVSHYTVAWVTAEELRMAIYNAFNQHQIEIPFPQRVVHIERMEDENARTSTSS
ncbi:MAG: mechanosensitive ion channel family protein [Calditrichaeota bacterium]|nr:mechanosensitive ion channel family protein [Calditrichota bacterium]